MKQLNRRYFLMGSLAATGVRTVRAQSAATIGAGVIGTGNRGSYDLSSVLAQPEAKVMALCRQAGYSCPVICTPEQLMEG